MPAGGHKHSWLGLGAWATQVSASSLSSVSSDSFPPVSTDRTLVSMDPSAARGQSIGGAEAFAEAECELEREHADAD